MKKTDSIFQRENSKEIHTTSTHQICTQSTTHTYLLKWQGVHLYTLWPQMPFAQFCYSRLNLKNYNVWVQKNTNP